MYGSNYYACICMFCFYLRLFVGFLVGFFIGFSVRSDRLGDIFFIFIAVKMQVIGNSNYYLETVQQKLGRKG